MNTLESTENRYSPYPTSPASRAMLDRIISLREAFAKDQISGRDFFRHAEKLLGKGADDYGIHVFGVRCADRTTDPRSAKDVFVVHQKTKQLPKPNALLEELLGIKRDEHAIGKLILGEDSQG
jgi:hypothetical protein